MPRSSPVGRTQQDELTTIIFEAVQSLPQHRKANFLLETSLDLIENGQYGPQVENYLDVYLRTPNLPKEDVAKALLARGAARRAAGEKLMAKAQQDLQAVSRLDPANRQLQSLARRDQLIHFMDEPASHRTPLEIWDRIASYIPRYHLRTWLFVSAFHRSIAVRQIFHTVDLYFGEDPENLSRGLDLFDRVKEDPTFASRVRRLRIHWAYEEGDTFDLVARIFRAALPEFKALKEFEWIGYPEFRAEMVQSVLNSHPHLQSLGLIGWHFDAVGVSAFRELREFTLRAEDDDGCADMSEIALVLDQNESSLRRLCLGAYLERPHSWDCAFQSSTIQNLTHLDLVDTRISHIVLARIAHAHNLQSLTLHGIFEQPSSASVLFGSDHIIDGKHTFLPHLESFRFVLIGHDNDFGLYQSVTQFLKKRTKLRRLDLGSCPWEMVQTVLPDLKNLRVLRVRIGQLDNGAVSALVGMLPQEMTAIHLATVIPGRPVEIYAYAFRSFCSLSILHLNAASCVKRPQPTEMAEKDYKLQTDSWISAARSVAMTVPWIDFLGWHGEHYVVARHEYREPELRELPPRRRLDCGTGVDLGSEDGSWLERKDVPIDYEMTEVEF